MTNSNNADDRATAGKSNSTIAHDHSTEFAVTVMLTNPDTDEVVVFSPGDIPPAWARELITNPNVWKNADGTTGDLPVAPSGASFLTIDDVQNADTTESDSARKKRS